MNISEELKSAGAYPSGPCSAYPRKRHEELMLAIKVTHATKVKASVPKMAGGLLKAAGQAIRYGRVSTEVREERYSTCKGCAAFIEDSKRCSECGCFMEAKTWIGGDPDVLCPRQKWSR